MNDLQNYILSTIDGDGYGVTFSKKIHKIKFVFECFKSEYLHKNNIAQYNRQPEKVLKEWLSGLPSSINIAFYNHEILSLGVLFDLIPANATEDQEDNFLDSWFEMIATELLNMNKPKLDHVKRI